MPKIFKKENKCTFGVNREAFTRVFCPHHPYPDPSIPGPGTYNAELKTIFQKRVNSSSSCNRNTIFEIDSDLPGPGHYEINSTFTATGRQFYSKYKSSMAPQYNAQKSLRFLGSILFISKI